MAGRNTPIQIDLEINADGVQAGSEQAATSLAQIEDQLHSLGDVSQLTGEKLDTVTSNVSESAKVVDRDLTDLHTSTAQALEEVGKSGEKGGKGISEGVGKGTKAAEKSGEEMKMTFANVGAGLASTMGDAGMVMSQAMYTMGPAGVAAGLALSAGLGIAQAALQGNADAINKNAADVQNLAQQLTQAGGSFSQIDFSSQMTKWGQSVQEQAQWWQIFGAQAKDGFQVIQDQSQQAGTSWTDAMKAAQGSTEDAQKFLDQTGTSYDQLTAKVRELQSEQGAYGTSDELLALQKQQKALEDQRTAAQKNIDTQKQAKQVYQDQKQLLSTVTTTVGGLTDAQKAQQTQQQANIQADKDEAAAIKGLADQQDKATSAIVTARTANNAMMDSFDAAKQTIAQNGKTVDENTKAGRDNLAMLVDMGQKIRANEKAQIANGQAVNDATSDMAKNRDELIKVAESAGMSKDAAEKLADQMGLTPKVVQTDFQSNAAQAKAQADDLHSTIDKVPTVKYTNFTLAGIEEAEAKIRDFVNKGWHLTVGVDGDVSALQNRIAGMNGTTVGVDFVGNMGGRAIN